MTTIQRNTSRCLLLLLLGALLAPTSATAVEVLDATAVARRACVQALDEGRLDDAYQCLLELWTEERDSMDASAKIEVLENLALVYVDFGDPDNAQRCYETILGIAPDWLPEGFSNQHEMIRKPILAAYEARGYTPYTPRFRNIGIATVEATDMTGSEDWSVLERALPNFMLTYMTRQLDNLTCSDSDAPLRVIDRAARDELLIEATESEQAPGFSNFQAIHGLIGVNVLALSKKQVNVAVRVVRTDSGLVAESWTGEGPPNEVMGMIQEGMAAIVSQLCEGAVLDGDQGLARLGDIHVAFQQLRRIDEALDLARDATLPIDIENAIDLVEDAIETTPESEELVLLHDQLLEQLDQLNVALGNTGRSIAEFDPGS